MRRVLERLTSCFEILRTWGKKHAPVFAFTLLILGGVFLFGHHAFAADDKVQSTAGNFLSWGFKLISWALGNFLTIVVIPVLLAAMNFSDIINAAPVVAGWVVVRDFTNLLFIIILLIISFGIIFGQDKYGKIDMLPQLFVVAIAINFSRTIVGFLNDISMVFMQTFVKAFSDAGAGNFVDLFSVDVSKDFTAPATSTPDAIGATVLANAAGMVTLLVATIILGYLAVIMMIRIVVLWILVIIAPLAWFMKLAESWGDHTYAEWWKELKAQMVLGPIMAFFIWLALATGGAASVEFTNADVAGGKLGSGSWANNGSATTQAAIKAIIAVAILYKGLEIAQKQGGVGSSMLGKAQGMAMKAGKGALALGTGGMAYSAITRAGLRAAGSNAEGASQIRKDMARWGKSTSLTAPLLADLGQTVQKRGGILGKVPVAGSFLHRQVSRAGSALDQVGEKMSKATEEAYAKQVTQGSADSRAEILNQLNSRPDSTLSAAEKIQRKELMKMVESDPKLLSKMAKDPQSMHAYQAAKQREIDDIKDPAQKRDAQHHFNEFMAKNAHRLPEKAFRIDDKGNQTSEEYNPQEALFKDMVEHDPEGLARTLAKDEIIMQSFMRSADTKDIAKVAKTDRLKKDDFNSAAIRSAPPEKVAALMGNLPASTRAGMHDNAELSEAIREKLKQAKVSDDAVVEQKGFQASTLSPDKAYDFENNPDGSKRTLPEANAVRAEAKQSFVANLEIHAANLAANPSDLSTMKDTIGVNHGVAGKDNGSFTSSAARKNFETHVYGKDAKLGAETLLKIPPAAMNGELAQSIADNLSKDVLLEIKKQIEAINPTIDPAVGRAVLEKLTTLRGSKGDYPIQEKMKGNKALEEYANPDVEKSVAAAAQAAADLAKAQEEAANRAARMAGGDESVKDSFGP